MNKSDTISDLAAAMVKAQGEMKNPALDSSNPFFKNKYASLAGVRDVVTPILTKNGLLVTQLLGHEEGGITCETVLLHSSGQWISEKLYMPATKNDAQGYGSAITYARRYALMAICGVVGDEDDDGSEASKKGTITPTTGVLGSLSAARQKVVIDTSVMVKDALNEDRPMDAYSLCETSNFDTDEKAALWSLLDSKQRSTLKRLAEAERGVQAPKTRKETEHNLAGQI